MSNSGPSSPGGGPPQQPAANTPGQAPGAPGSEPTDSPAEKVGFFGSIKALFSSLPTFTAAGTAIVAMLALVGVTTDALPRVALNAPFALAASYAILVLLFVVSIAWAQPGAATKSRWPWRVGAGLGVGLPLSFLMLMGAWVSTEGTTPDVSVGLTATADQPGQDDGPVHYAYSAAVTVNRVQADELVEIWVWPTDRDECITSNLPPPPGPDDDGPPDDPDSPDMLYESQAGVTSDGSLSRTVTGHVVLDAEEGLCVAADLPGRCGWRLPGLDLGVGARIAIAPITQFGWLEKNPSAGDRGWCVLGRDERNTHVFAFPDPPPQPPPVTSTPAPPTPAVLPDPEPTATCPGG